LNNGLILGMFQRNTFCHYFDRYFHFCWYHIICFIGRLIKITTAVPLLLVLL